MSVYPLSLIKPLLGIDLADTSQDVQLQLALDAVEAQVQHLTRLRLAPVMLTEWYAGNWSRTLRLREGPVRSVTSVEKLTGDSDGAWGLGDVSVLEVIDPGVWFLKLDHQLLTTPPVAVSLSGTLVSRRGWDGALERRRGRVVRREVEGNGNYKVVYEAGFPANQVPAEFLPAVAAGVAYLRRTVPTGGLVVTGQSMEGVSVTLTDLYAQIAADGIQRLGEVQSLVSRYRRPYVG